MEMGEKGRLRRQLSPATRRDQRVEGDGAGAALRDKISGACLHLHALRRGRTACSRANVSGWTMHRTVSERVSSHGGWEARALLHTS